MKSRKIAIFVRLLTFSPSLSIDFNIDMLQHLEDILKNKEIFVTSLNMTANKVKKGKKRLKV